MHVAVSGTDIVISLSGVLESDLGLAEATAKRSQQTKPRILLDTRHLDSLKSSARKLWFDWIRTHCADVEAIYVIGGGAIFRMVAATLALGGVKMHFVDSPRDVPNPPEILAA